MKLTVPVRLSGIFLLITAMGIFYYWEGENFSDGAVSGTYTLQLSGEASTLVLRPDHSFQQELRLPGKVGHAEGTWRVSGEGHIAFSREFLKVTGEDLSPGGQAFGQIENRFGLVWITLAPNPNGPTFHKRGSAELFRLLELLCGFHHLTTFSKLYYLFANLLLIRRAAEYC